LTNGGTDVFLSLMQFALSDLASSDWEQALALWFAWHDQNLVGLGVMGFSLEEVHWDAAQFPEQKAFLLRAIDSALAGYRRAELCYDPPYVDLYLREYREIVEPFELPADFQSTGLYGWPGPDDPDERCPKHGVHCSLYGWCRVCVHCGTDRLGG